MAELFKNTFSGGLDTSTSKAFIEPNKYIEGLNVDLTDITGANRFYSLKNIAGTTKLSELGTNIIGASAIVVGVSYRIITIGTTDFTLAGASANTVGVVFTATSSTIGTGMVLTIMTDIKIIGAFNNTYLLPDGITKASGITIFFTYTNASTNYLQIQAYIINTATVYSLYNQVVSSTYVTDNISIDATSYPESTFDYLYFTDNYYKPRKLKCVIPSAYTANFLQEYDLEFLRKKALGDILLNNISTGGALLTGTYQLAYQLVSEDKTKFTNFSLLTNPIHIYTTVDGVVRAGIGLPSNKKISIHITPTEAELAEYYYFRVAVVENISPQGVVTTDTGITNLELISDYLISGYIQDFEITSNKQLSSITLDELIVDLVAFDKVKSLRVRDNRLLYANTTLTALEYDNGTPFISTTPDESTILRESGTSDSFSNEIFSTNTKGYFRGEVYRYCVSYFDAFGNFSYPSVLDCSNIQDNQITSGVDMKFPDRTFTAGGRYYSVMDSSNNTVSLGLELMGLDNHPTWAKGFVILRAKRKKNVLFQTPLVPLASFYGIGTVGEYPTIYQDYTGTVTDTTLSPMGPSTVFYPSNLFYGGLVESDELPSALAGGSQPNKKTFGEANGLSFSSIYNKTLIFPPDSIYGGQDYQFSGNESVSTVDATITRLYFKRFDTNGFNCGSGENTSCSGSFFASINNDYYYNNGHSGAKPAIRSSDNSLLYSKFFDNFSAASTLNGAFIYDSDKLTTQITTLGTTPTVQRSTAIQLGSDNTVLSGPYASPSLSFASGSPTYVTNTVGLLHSGDYITSTTGLYGNYTNVVELVNITKNLAEDRYGDISAFNEYIYTGTKRIFTDSEVETYISTGDPYPIDNLHVFGGDCIVSPHTFKISDNNYTVVNAGKKVAAGITAATLLTNWSKVWLNTAGESSVIMMPAPVKKSAQYLTVVLESEYHGSVRDLDTYKSIGTYNFVIPGATTESAASTPLNYNYNINLNKENDQKVFYPQNELSININRYPNRIYFTDQKIYNSTIQGFDITRALNFKDFTEKFGEITSLAIGGDDLYAINKQGILYIPVGQRIIEASDASQLSIQSGEILGDAVVVDSVRGGTHLKGIVETGQELFIVDQINKDIYKLSGRELHSITKSQNISNQRSMFDFGTPILDRKLVCVYDYYRDHLWIYNRETGNAHIFNNKLGVWQGAYAFSGNLQSAIFNQGLYVIGYDYEEGDNTGYFIESMYTGDHTRLFGTLVTPYVDFIVNPEVDFGKTFDALLLNASNPLTSVNITIERNDDLGQQTSGVANTLNLTRSEGNYKVKTLRDSNSARLRGLYAILRVRWETGEDAVETYLNSVITTYRQSK